MRSRTQYCGAALILGAAVAGCAPTRFVEGVRPAADRFGVRDAETRCVTGRGYLRFNSGLESDLEDALAQGDSARLREEGARVLRAAHALAVHAVDGEIDRLPEAGLDSLVRAYGLSAPGGTKERRAFLKEQFAAQSMQALEAELERPGQAGDLNRTRRLLESVHRGIEPPVAERGKLARSLIGAPLFLPATIGAEISDAEAMQRAAVADVARVREYRPPTVIAPLDAAALEEAEIESLARWYAPVLLQEIDPEAHYPAADDFIGRVCLTGAQDDVHVHVDVSEPVVYWARGAAKVREVRYEQLIYAVWYPRRPALEPDDASAGHIDGVVIRVTLDRHRRPAIYEFVRSCGCYHTLWVAEYVEAAARREFGPPLKRGDWAVQKRGGPRELFLPALVADDGMKPRGAVGIVSAGHHLALAIWLQGASPPTALERSLSYVLESYESLTHLPLGDGVASMFGGDGLVHDAGRREGWLLAPTGMLSAGQPRQLGTMKIRMDAYDYDDPRLLERNLRLPSSF